MTTYIPFTPSQTAVYSTQVILDGQPYTLTTPWNVYGQRYYINISGLNNTRILSLPLIGSPTGVYISSIDWEYGVVTVTTQKNHNYRVGDVIKLNIINCAPVGYNGNFDCLITGPTSFTYLLDSDPGVNTTLGAAQYNINLVAGYFNTSTLVYRTNAQQFEVTP